jgi:glycosyltransferase involved in cell wall biosynthesis
MDILLLGRKDVAKSEDIVAALERLGHGVDFVLFPNFHYMKDRDAYETSRGGRYFSAPRSRKAYYFKHFFSILFLLFSDFRKKRYDVLFAIDWFEGVMLLIYKYLFARKARMVFYSYDFYFFDSVFSSRYVINRIDRWVARRADEVWNVNDAIRKERERQGTFSKLNRTVPLGMCDKAGEWSLKDPRSFLFVGNLKQGHNLVNLVRVFSTLAKEDGRFRLTIVGCGNEEERIRKEIRREGVEDNVCLRGFVPEQDIVREIREGRYAYGVALYEKTREVVCVDPGKVKDYLSWGMPVLTTSANGIAEDIRRYGLGKVATSDDVESLVALFREADADTIRKQRENVRRYVSERSFDALLSLGLTEGAKKHL